MDERRPYPPGFIPPNHCGGPHTDIPHWHPGWFRPGPPPVFNTSIPQSEYDNAAISYLHELGRLRKYVDDLYNGLRNYTEAFNWYVKYGIEEEFKWHFDNDIQPIIDRIDKDIADLREYVDTEIANLREYVDTQDAAIRQSIADLRAYVIEQDTLIRETIAALATRLDAKDADLQAQIDANKAAIEAALELAKSELQAAIDAVQSNLDAYIALNDAAVAETNTRIDDLRQITIAHIADKTNPHDVTKEQVGLDQVDNTSDANKPISDAAAEKNAQQDTAIQAVNDKVDNFMGSLSDVMSWVAGGNLTIDADAWTLVDTYYIYNIEDANVQIGDRPFVYPDNPESSIVLGTAGLVSDVANDGSIRLTCLTKPSDIVSISYFALRRRNDA